jgi:hypothetical protein
VQLLDLDRAPFEACATFEEQFPPSAPPRVEVTASRFGRFWRRNRRR